MSSFFRKDVTLRFGENENLMRFGILIRFTVMSDMDGKAKKPISSAQYMSSYLFRFLSTINYAALIMLLHAVSQCNSLDNSNILTQNTFV